MINFSLGVSSYLAEAAACGGDVVGLDWALPLDEAWARVGFDRPVQGNLDPVSLLAPWRELRVQDRRRAEPRGRPAGPRLQRRPRPDAADAGGQRAPARRARPAADVGVIGVLVMAYGGPASLDEIPGYLADIRHGRPTPRARARRDHRELPRDRRVVAAPRRLAAAGRRSRRPSSGTTSAATSACGTGRRGSKTSSARWSRTA